ncbi:unnamed protein product [Linum tenue]|uniref:Uncharacterized protein n=1 Tax=Linum tenue TaxID=586396 RepID=A0AAV0S131_9ROSI|nr:unnamed protein product [Linum tenue]
MQKRLHAYEEKEGHIPSLKLPRRWCYISCSLQEGWLQSKEFVSQSVLALGFIAQP